MSVELVNGHVLFPHPPNWKESLNWERRWENEIAPGVTGAESRNALRAVPRLALEFLITPRSIQEQSRFDDRIRAAKKSGLACCAQWGRAVRLTANAVATDTLITVEAGWEWAAGQYIFLQDSGDNYEVGIIAAATQDVDLWNLTLEDPLAGSFAAGSLAAALLFGKFSVEDMPVRSPKLGGTRIRIEERTSGDAAQLGALEADAGTGIGHWRVEDTFIVQ